jgi:Protein of unknown function (DUF4254)
VKAGPSLPTAAWLVKEMEGAIRGDPDTNGSGWGTFVGELVRSNLRQWDLEDSTRDPLASDAVVAGAKREIDRLNAERHRLMQQIDEAIDSTLNRVAAAPLATESPGMVVDRLSVLVIRRVRTMAASSQQLTYAARVPLLDSQLASLSLAFDTYMQELRSGTRRFLPYRHLKLYGTSASPAD